jgi:hypothetical protein
MAIETKAEMKAETEISSQGPPPRSRRRRVGDLAVSLAMVAVLIALYVLVVTRGQVSL